MPRSVPAGTPACPRPPTLGLFNLGKPAGQERGGGLTPGSRKAWGRRSLLESLVPQTEWFQGQGLAGPQRVSLA